MATESKQAPAIRPRREDFVGKRIKVKGFYGDDLTPMVQDNNQGLDNFVADVIIKAEASGLADREAANPLQLTKADRELRKELNRAVPRKDILQIDGYLPGSLSFDYIMKDEILCMEIFPVGAFIRVVAEIKDDGGKKAIQYTITQVQDGVITGDQRPGARGRTGLSTYKNLWTTVSNDGRIEWQGPVAGGSVFAKLVDSADAKRLQKALNLAGTTRGTTDGIDEFFRDI